ncbi:MAG: Dabb family protein [Planctomycetota bacterium]|jgi:hypothetical protein
MLKHIVLMKFRPDAPEGAVQEIIDALKALPATILEIQSLEVGGNVVENPRNVDLGLIVEFAGRPELDRYAMHPDHQIVVEQKIRPILESSVVVDFEA